MEILRNKRKRWETQS